jgi:dTDP-4-dehydrorhamnose 3,5-epimerase
MQTFNELLPGVKLIKHRRFPDLRGDFCEFWKTDNDGLRGTFRQLNMATSRFNVLRGMHRQNQTKLVMPVVGKIFDVALNPETGAWCAAILDADTAFLIPPEYAHGYLVLSDNAVVQYVVDTPYVKEVEEHFAWNAYNIDWPTEQAPVMSEKDTPK